MAEADVGAVDACSIRIYNVCWNLVHGMMMHFPGWFIQIH